MKHVEKVLEDLAFENINLRLRVAFLENLVKEEEGEDDELQTDHEAAD